MSAANSSAMPITVASATFPGRMWFIQRPMSRAIGIVHAMVKRPHGLSRSALTTTSASTASRMIMIAKIAIIAARPATGLTSSFAICPSDLPSRRTEAHRIKKSCTAPPSTTPAMSHRVPGRNPNCAARVGPTNGPAPEMAEKWWPKSTHFDVTTKSRPLFSRSAGVARHGSRPKTLSAMKRE